MKTNLMASRLFILLFFQFIALSNIYSQYLDNPSMEGEILMIGPPPDWGICIGGSTPNVQPGKYAVYLPPSDGITYVGLLTRADFTWEDMYSTLNVPLSKDSCYSFKIDLAFWEYLSFTTVDPIILRFYGGSSFCDKETLLWQSPPISNIEWQTFEFKIQNEEFDISDLIIESYFVSTYPYWGYVLLDNILIEPYPFIELGNDTTITICEEGSYLIEAGEGFSSYLWQDGSTESVYLADTTGLYWVEVSTDDGCSAMDSIFVTIEEYIEMVSETADSIMSCAGQEVEIWVDVINGLEPYSYEWFGLADTLPEIFVTPDTSTYYYVEIADACGDTITDSVRVVVLPIPEFDLGPDTAFCEGDTFLLNPGGGYMAYHWQDGSTDSVYYVTEPGTYWVQVVAEGGCSATDQVDVEFFFVDINLGVDTVICVGETVTFDAGEGHEEYLWQDGSSGHTFDADETGYYWCTVTDDNGCSGADTVFLSVEDDVPDVDLGADTNLCYGDIMVLYPGLYNAYVWQNGSTDSIFVVTQPGTYWVEVAGGCGNGYDTVNVSYNDPIDIDLGADTNLCSGGSLQLDAGFGYASYLWQDGSGSVLFNVSESGLYYVIVSDYNGCTGGDTISVEVANEVDLGQDTSFCTGDTWTLNAGYGFDMFSWSTGDITQTVEVTSAGEYWVDVEYYFGCPSTDTIVLGLIPLPDPDLGDDLGYCKGDSVILTGSEGDFEYFWNGVEGEQTYTVTEEGNYELLEKNFCGEDSDEIYVEEYELPEVYLGEDTILFDGEINLDAGAGFEAYLWQDGSGDRYYVVTYEGLTDTLYYVEVTDENFCKSTDTIVIEIFDLEIPIVITPNGDGKNDRFEPKNGSWNGIRDHTMLVYNRWGEKVWESNNFPAGWDGKRNGNYVADGTYFWILEVYYGPKNAKATYKGSLTVLRTE